MNIKPIIILFLFILLSCKQTKKESVVSVLRYWENREISFPNNLTFTIQGEDILNCSMNSKYRIISYMDSTGCTSCRLKLNAWKSFMASINSAPDSNLVQLLFFINSKDKERICHLLSDNRFEYPVCIDIQDSINILNNFPKDMTFQTFLLDENNRVLLVGNPVYNSRIKELYLKTILGEGVIPVSKERKHTEVILNRTHVNLGTFDWQQEQLVEFILTNVGKELLVIEDVITSCGCVMVEYSKAPIRPNESIVIRVKYKAQYAEYFSKTITVYCNVRKSPFQLRIMGNAK